MQNIKSFFEKKSLNKLIEVNGWVENRKNIRENIFILMIRDGSTIKNLQVVCDKKNMEDTYKKFSKVLKGSSVKLYGKLIKSSLREIELIVSKGIIVGKITNTYKIHSINVEDARKYPHMRLRLPLFQAVTQFRSFLMYEIHTFYNKLGFHNVTTPIITSKSSSMPIEISSNKRYLTNNAQLHLETFACAFDKVYTIGPVFNKNNPLIENWQLECEISFIDFNDLIEHIELFIKYLCAKVLEKCGDLLDYFDANYDNNLRNKIEVTKTINSLFLRKKYEECMIFLNKEVDCGNIILDKGGKNRRLGNGDLILNKKIEFGDDFEDDIISYLLEEFGNKPFFLFNFPKDFKNYYMKQNEDNISIVEKVSLMVPIIGELAVGSMREDKLEKLRELTIDDNIDWYEELRSEGSVPHGGYKINIEKLMCFFTGIKDIRDVIPYYRTKKDCYA